MLFLEIAAQGLKGCSQTARAPLKPGYVVLKPPGAEPVPLASLTMALLYNDGRGEDAAFGARAGAKVAFTLQGRDHGAYRVVRELGGPGALQQLNKVAQKFETVTSDVLEMGQVIRSGIGAPQKSAFEYLFTLTDAQLPSRKPKKTAPASARKPSSAPLPPLEPVQPAADVQKAQARLRELEAELEVSAEIEQLQFEQDGLASQLFELESKLRSTEGLTQALRQAEAELANAPTPEALGLPDDIQARVERYPSLMQKRDEALAKLQAERETQAQGSFAVEPLWRDLRFLASAGLGVAFLAAGIILREGLSRYVALLDIPAFGFAALVALKWVDDLQGSQRVGRKEGRSAAREKRIHDDFEAEAQQVKSAMRALGVESAQDVLEVLARRPAWADRVAELRAELQGAEADPEQASARRQYDALKAKADELSRQMQSRASGYVRDAREVERDLERVRQSIALASGPARAAFADEPISAQESSAHAQHLEDPSPVLLSLAADLLQTDIPGLAALIADRFAQYLGALSDRRYASAQWDAKGNATLVAAGAKVPASVLPPRDLDLYFLALRLTLVEKLTGREKTPLVIDDVLDFLGEAKQGLAARMLKHLGTLTQVLHVTRNPSYPPMADAAASL